jgi:GAF domain-containing protein
MFHDRLDEVRESYIEQLRKTPEAHRSDIEVHRAILDEILQALLGDLEAPFRELEGRLEAEVEARRKMEAGNRLEAMFHRIGQAVLEEWPLVTLTQIIEEECTSLLGCDFTTVFVPDVSNPAPLRFQGRDRPLKPFVEEIRETGAVCLVDNLSGDPRTTIREPQTGLCPVRNLLAHPIRAGDAILGVIACADKGGDFSTADGGTLSRIANRIGVILRKAQIQEEILERLSRLAGRETPPPLRRSFLDALQEILSEAETPQPA